MNRWWVADNASVQSSDCWLLSGFPHVALFAALLMAGVSAQSPIAASPPAVAARHVTVAELTVLADVGVPAREIIALCDRRGWPPVISTEDLGTIFAHPIDTDLRARLVRLSGNVPEVATWTDTYAIVDFAAPFAGSALYPRGFVVEPKPGPPATLSIATPGVAQLFENTRFFVWFVEWGAKDIVGDATTLATVAEMLKREREIAFSTLSTPILSSMRSPRGGGEVPLVLFQAVSKNERKGLLALAARTDVAPGFLVIAGVATGPDVSHDAVQPEIDRLSVILTSICRRETAR